MEYKSSLDLRKVSNPQIRPRYAAQPAVDAHVIAGRAVVDRVGPEHVEGHRTVGDPVVPGPAP